MDKEFWENEKKFKENQRQREQTINETAKQRIKKKVKISVETCAIGALADMENALGFLWRHGEKIENLTAQEKKIRDRWMEVRDSILDRAENSKKLLLREVERCEFKDYVPNKYTTILRSKEYPNGRE